MNTYPTMAADKFEAFVTNYGHLMDAASLAQAQKALSTLKQRGAPDPTTYSLRHIDATDADDLSLKLHLATAQAVQDHYDGKLALEQVSDIITPLLMAVTEALLDTLLSGKTFPLHVDLDA